jgi:hypothetical protein
MNTYGTPTLRSAPRHKDNQLVHMRLDTRAAVSLAEVKGGYERLLDRPVSTSLAVRRGLALLADHLGGIDSPAKVQAEMAELVHHVR